MMQIKTMLFDLKRKLIFHKVRMAFKEVVTPRRDISLGELLTRCRSSQSDKSKSTRLGQIFLNYVTLKGNM